MNPQTMTEQQVRDALAELAGWKLEPYGKGHIWYPKGWPDCSVGIRSGDEHPIPATLDEAAKLPEGWDWWKDSTDYLAQGPSRVFVRSSYLMKNVPERLARFRLRLAVELAERSPSSPSR